MRQESSNVDDRTRTAYGHIATGWAHFLSDNCDAAFAEYDKAIALNDPQTLGLAHVCRALVYVRLGQDRKAVEEHQAASIIAVMHGDDEVANARDPGQLQEIIVRRIKSLPPVG